MSKLNILIAGSTGYIGVQLINLLIKHRYIKIKYLCGNNSVGKKISYYDKSLKDKKLPRIVKFNKKYLKEVDVIFTALPNGEAQEISKKLLSNNTLIDLAADFRLEKASEYLKWYKKRHKAPKQIKNSIYSLPEITGKKKKTKKTSKKADQSKGGRYAGKTSSLGVLAFQNKSLLDNRREKLDDA